MTRDDLYEYYRRVLRARTTPRSSSSATSTPTRCCAGSREHFGGIRAGPPRPARARRASRSSWASGACGSSREGTTAYLKLAYHAPAVGDPDFFPMLVLDAVLTGAKGVNLWSSFRTPPPQRSARLYRALVERRLASSVAAAMLPTEHPFLYSCRPRPPTACRSGTSRRRRFDELDTGRRRRHQPAGARQGEEPAAGAARVRERQRDEHRAPARVLPRPSRPSTGTTTARRSSRPSPRTTWAGSRGGTCTPANRTVGWFEPLPAGGDGRRRRCAAAEAMTPADRQRTGARPARAGQRRRGHRQGGPHDSRGEPQCDRACGERVRPRRPARPEPPGLARHRSRHRAADQPTRLPTSSTGAACRSRVRSTRHALSLVCTCLAEDLEAVLDVVGDILMRPDVPRGGDRDAARRDQLTAIRQDEDSPAVVAMEGLFGLLYPGGHPYGRPATGTGRHAWTGIDRSRAAGLSRGALRARRRCRSCSSATSIRRGRWPRRPACSGTGGLRRRPSRRSAEPSPAAADASASSR